MERQNKNQFYFGTEQSEHHESMKKHLGNELEKQEEMLLENGGYFVISNRTFDQLFEDLNKLMEDKAQSKVLGLNNRNFHQIVNFYLVLSRNIIKHIGDFYYCANIGYTKLTEKYNFNRKHILTYINILTHMGYLKVVKMYQSTNNYYPQLVLEAELTTKE